MALPTLLNRLDCGRKIAFTTLCGCRETEFVGRKADTSGKQRDSPETLPLFYDPTVATPLRQKGGLHIGKEALSIKFLRQRVCRIVQLLKKQSFKQFGQRLSRGFQD